MQQLQQQQQQTTTKFHDKLKPICHSQLFEPRGHNYKYIKHIIIYLQSMQPVLQKQTGSNMGGMNPIALVHDGAVHIVFASVTPSKHAE